MTQDEIIEIYKEVSNKLCDGKEWCWAGVGEPLQMFAKLVAEHERERTKTMLEYLDMKAQPYHSYYKHAAVCLYGTVGEGELL